MSGRPLRFLGLVASLWVGWRIYALWPQADLPAALASPVEPAREAVGVPASVQAVPTPPAFSPPPLPSAVRPGKRPFFPPSVATSLIALPAPVPAAPALLVEGVQSTVPPGLPLAPASPAPATSHPRRWSGSAWAVLRKGGAPPPGPTSGQLGGGQAGIRVAYLIAPAQRIAAVARLTSPTSGPGREAALGVEWQPTRLPIRLVAERRVAIDGGRGGNAVGAIGGIGPLAIGGGFDLEAYAQGGMVRRARTEPFVDGSVRMARPVIGRGATRIDIGLGLSGGAQREAARLDLGPSIALRTPLAGRSARLALDWRQRIAGDARPGSGLALMLGCDF